MYGLLQDGPCAHQHIWIDGDEAPEVTTVEAPVTGDDWLVPIPLGGEFPEAKFESHTYRCIGVDRVPSPVAPEGVHALALYVYAPELARAA